MKFIPGGSSAIMAKVEARREQVSKLYLGGKSQYEIATTLTPEFPTPSGKPISQQTIAKDLKIIRSEWRSSAVRNFDAMKSMELAKVDQVELEAWQAWQRSIGKTKTVTKHAEAGGAKEIPGKRFITEKIEVLNGDPRFLAIINECIKRRCDILGLDAPKRLTGDDGGPVSLRVVFENQ